MTILILISCAKRKIPDANYQGEMRSFIINISKYAKSTDSSFIVVPQNGARLLTFNGNEQDLGDLDYLSAIDGQGQEDLFYGYDNDDEPTLVDDRNEILPFLDKAVEGDLPVLVTDYCFSSEKIQDSYLKNEAKNYVSFAATDRELSEIPTEPIHNENEDSITKLSDINNFLYLINPTPNFDSQEAFIQALDATNYDLFIIDAFYESFEPLTEANIEKLQTKPNGEKRLVLAYMSIGEAEDYRYYWQSSWNKRKTKPNWLYKENSRWAGNYKVFYWIADWQAIIYGNQEAYLDKILAAGFDGVYLDIVDAFETYEAIKK